MTTPVPSTEPAPAETAAPAAVTPPAAPAAPPVPSPPPAAPAAPAPVEPPAGDDGAETPEIAKVRREAARYRTERNTEREQAAAVKAERDAAAAKATGLEEMLAKLAAVLNPDANEPPDPAKLADDLAAEKAQREQDRADLTAQHDAKVRELTLRAALPAAYAKAGADAAALNDSLGFQAAVAKLDPTADTFAADLESAVTAAVEANPKLKVAPVATRSGTEIAGRSGGVDQLTREQVAALSKSDPAALVKAQKEGRLRNLGVS
jgi:hypothetical protein